MIASLFTLLVASPASLAAAPGGTGLCLTPSAACSLRAASPPGVLFGLLLRSHAPLGVPAAAYLALRWHEARRQRAATETRLQLVDGGLRWLIPNARTNWLHGGFPSGPGVAFRWGSGVVPCLPLRRRGGGPLCIIGVFVSVFLRRHGFSVCASPANITSSGASF
jgi:hypothetical protein